MVAMATLAVPCRMERKQVGSTWVSMVPWQIPARATAGLPAQNWDPIRGSHPSRKWVGAGQGAAVAPGDGVDHQEVEYPQPGHPQVYFPPWGWAGGKAWAPLPHSTLLLLSCGVAFADSCEGRCEEGFDAGRKCQCDTLCVYYQSCCSDYSTVCKAKGTVPMATLLGTGEWGGCGCSTLWGLRWVSSAPACVCRVKSAPGLAAAHGVFGSWLIAIWSVESMLIG